MIPYSLPGRRMLSLLQPVFFFCFWCYSTWNDSKMNPGLLRWFQTGARPDWFFFFLQHLMDSVHLQKKTAFSALAGSLNFMKETNFKFPNFELLRSFPLRTHTHTHMHNHSHKNGQTHSLTFGFHGCGSGRLLKSNRIVRMWKKALKKSKSWLTNH